MENGTNFRVDFSGTVLNSEHEMGLKFFSPMAFSAILIFRFLPYKAKSELRGKITKKIKAPFFIHCKKTVSEKSTPNFVLFSKV